MNKFRNIDWLKWTLAFGILVVSIIVRWAIPTTPLTNFVFDEVYFVPQTESYAVNRYYYDPHPALGRIFLYYGMKLYNPDAASILTPDLLQNKGDNYKSPLNLEGARFFPKVFGSILPVVVFLLAYEIVNWRKRKQAQLSIANYLVPLVVGLMIAFENTLIVESRYALLSQIMLVFMMASCYLAVLYYKFRRDHQDNSRRTAAVGLVIWLTTAVLVGMAVSVKWLTLSIVPFVAIFLWYADFKFSQQRQLWRRIALATVNIFIVAYVAFLIHLSVYVWHFNKIQHYSPAAAETIQSYQDDLQNGTNTTSFWAKFMDWQRLQKRYEDGVPMLDYGKADEIGSMWTDWPIMARPINYYWERDDKGNIRTIELIGNPVVWVMGLVGLISLTGLCLARLFGKNGVEPRHFMLVMLYFANWLPFALITRVMYLYHYMPALVVSVLMFGVFVHDFVLPRKHALLTVGGEVLKRYMQTLKAKSRRLKLLRFVDALKQSLYSYDAMVMAVCIISLVITMLGFYFYAPLTYMLPLTQPEFEQRILLKEWHMKWP